MSGRLFFALASLLLSATACSGEGSGPATPAPSSRSTPGDPTTSWQPAVPAEPVAEADVRSSHDGVLDDVSEAVDGQAPGLTWSSSVLRTEDFEGSCAVTLERTADGPVPPPGDDTLDLSALSAAVAGHGFGDLATADDPGGAVRYLAHGDAALFELRSKDVTTVAVRVATTEDACDD